MSGTLDGRFPPRALWLAVVLTAVLALVAYWIDQGDSAQRLLRQLPDMESVTGPLDRLVRPTGLVPLFIFCLMVALASTPQGREWLARRPLALSPGAMSAFRVALAMGLGVVVYKTVPSGGLRIVWMTLLGAFAIGGSRISFAAFVVSFTYWLYPRAATEHDMAMPLRTLWLMMLVPWNAGFGVKILRRHAGDESPSRAFGLAVWIPILMLGLAYAAAAFAKLDEVGLEWITGGAVRHIFTVDADRAPLTLGRMIASRESLSVAFSAAAVVGEAVIILAAMTPNRRVTLAAGLIAVSLQLGFWVFQGVWWPAWWVLLLAFLPWQTIADAGRSWHRPATDLLRVASTTSADNTRQREWRGALVGTLLFLAAVQQPLVSLARQEYPRLLLSDFPMYSNVDMSPAAVRANAASQAMASIRLRPSDGSSGDAARANLRMVDPDSVVVMAARKLHAREPLTSGDLDAVNSVTARYASRFGREPARIDILADTWRFEWSAAGFLPRANWTHVATLDLSQGALQSK